MRDPNERAMMSNLKGIEESPMYTFIEQIAGVAPSETPKHEERKHQSKNSRGDGQRRQPQQQQQQQEFPSPGQDDFQYEEGEEENFDAFIHGQIDPDEYEVVKSSLQILEDIQNSAQTPEDLRGELANEIFSTCSLMRRKIAKVIEVKSFAGVDDGITVRVKI